MRDHPSLYVQPFVVLGFLSLAVPTIVLVGLGGVGAVLSAQSVATGAVLLLVVGGTMLGLRFEWRTVLRSSDVRPVGRREMLSDTAAVFGGAILALAVTVELGLSPVVSAGLVGIAAALMTPRQAIPAYCGAFVGMTSPELFPTYWHALLASGIASGVFVLAQPVFYGVGGKLGTTAFVGATITVLLTAGSFHSEPLPDTVTIVLVVGYAAIGAVATFSIHARLPPDAVFASGLVGAVGGVTLPAIHGDPGSLMAAAVFAASFAGMAVPERIPSERWIALTGVIVGLLFVFTMPYLGGSGGKLGTIAFGSCLAIHGLLGTLHISRARRQLEGATRRDVT
ncbi:hypothetical protein ACLI4Y_11210 [Natrialbaceae archaeon A-CW3]